ncbi:response regulator [Castellaniella hirudinis]|uniref:response regulator n=1 Tax=Castellaniella hirudinis TaxID=1144617 RepID=UPI0039C075E7
MKIPPPFPAAGQPIRHCLLVDDQPDALALLAGLVQSVFPAARQVHADSLDAALRALPTQRYDLALIDLELGDGNGCALITRLRRQQSQCLCVVSTIFEDDDALVSALKAGAQGYLLKGQPADQVRLQLQGMGSGLPPLSPAIARRLIQYFQQAAPEIEDGGLSEREKEVLSLLAKGLRLSEIGRLLGISRHTVGDHVKSIYRKLNISSRAEAALFAQRLKLV